ncbi:vitamin K epoxide reductase family protein [uncultured Dokdonia sp.]|uniref:vitamin K epoxide reductase family protein n=1 Tax=uncultured Dokdonia sp. TaxID=575653 RepID=UPI002632324C|nr:vitamin K epoxide reductase family protein [uncultured Dokdonia sp.]
MQDQLFNILDKLLVTNKIRLNKEELKLQLLSHPSYPSLHALTGVLKHFGVPNLALQVPTDKDTLDQLPPTFIANVKGDQGMHLGLIEKKDANVHIYTDHKQVKTVSNDTFFDIWDGIIVAVEKDETIKEGKGASSSKIWQWAFISIALGIGISLLSKSFIFEGIHYFLSTIGLILGVLIVGHSLGLESSSTASICNLSEKTSCDAVLNSKGAKIGGLLTLSDASIIAFAGYTLTYCFSLLGSIPINGVIVALSFLAIPFVLYSIYYQASVLKKWCPLCLGIASVLILQAVAAIVTGNSTAFLSVGIEEIGIYVLSLVIIMGIWFMVKPLLHKKVALDKLKIESNKFKRNFSIFNTLLGENDSITNDIVLPKEIVLGNRDALLEVVLVTSPLCFYCKQAHTDIENVLKQVSNDIKVIIRFNVNVEDTEGEGFQITSRLIHAYNTEGELACIKMMHEVYQSDVDLKQWLKKQPAFDADYSDVLNAQKEWCTQNNINFTPALYIQGNQFPREYDRNDLPLFIEDLVELQQQENQVIDSPMMTS